MQRPRLPQLLSVAFVLELVVRLGWVFERLPDPLASHFDLSGRPNGYEGKTSFALVAVGVSLFLLALFTSLPRTLMRMPHAYINLPNKAYWLAPERRAETFARLGTASDWMGCLTLGFLSAVFELVIRANLQRAPLSGQVWLLTVGYVIVMLSVSLGLFRMPKLPQKQP